MPECAGKVRYPNRLVALMSAVRRTNADAEEPAEALRPYRCSQCKGWHLTSKPDLRGDDGWTVKRMTTSDSNV